MEPLPPAQPTASTLDRLEAAHPHGGFDLDALKRRRAELRESMGALEQALAAPTPGLEATWSQRVHVALVELSADFREHMRITEGPEGLYQEVLNDDPRLSGKIARLTHEHEIICGGIDAALAGVGAAAASDAGAVREAGIALLARLARHRQAGADLVYEAFEAELGGQD
jgi:hypothetical protein